MRNHLTKLFQLTACAVLMLATANLSAADKKADPTGTWTWTAAGRNGGEGRKMTAKLKAEGDKLTGSVVTPGREGGEPRTTEISDGKVTGEDISFNVVREFNGNKMTQKFTGKVAGDTIKGKISFQGRDGEERSRDWEATREAAKKDEKK
jgi:hypothetical protein